MDGNTLQRRLSDCGMNFNVNTKTAACDLSRHRRVGWGGGGCESLWGAIYSNLWASPTWKWASKEWRITGKTFEGVCMRPDAHHRSETSKIIDRPLPKSWTIRKPLPSFKFGCEFAAVRFILLAPQSGRVNRSSVLNLPAGVHSPGLLWLLSGFYSAQHRMAEYSNSSWQSHQPLVPSFPQPQLCRTPQRSRLFIYNLLWKSPVLWLR